jgi:hypothetical protein
LKFDVLLALPLVEVVVIARFEIVEEKVEVDLENCFGKTVFRAVKARMAMRIDTAALKETLEVDGRLVDAWLCFEDIESWSMARNRIFIPPVVELEMLRNSIRRRLGWMS